MHWLPPPHHRGDSDSDSHTHTHNHNNNNTTIQLWTDSTTKWNDTRGYEDLENHAIPPRKTTLVLAVPVAPDNTVFIAMCAAKDASKPQGPDVTST